VDFQEDNHTLLFVGYPVSTLHYKSAPTEAYTNTCNQPAKIVISIGLMHQHDIGKEAVPDHQTNTQC
jgi:hypothetical protein